MKAQKINEIMKLELITFSIKWNSKIKITKQIKIKQQIKITQKIKFSIKKNQTEKIGTVSARYKKVDYSLHYL